MSKPKKSLCATLPPEPSQILGREVENGEDLSCLKPDTHRNDEHVFKTRDGEYIAWEVDDECGCCDDIQDEEDMCITYRSLTSREVREFLKDNEKGRG